MKTKILIFGLMWLCGAGYSSAKEAQGERPTSNRIQDLAAKPLAPGSLDARVLDLIRRAGEAEDDLERLRLLERLAEIPDLPPPLAAQTRLLVDAVNQWNHSGRLTRWPDLFRKDDPGFSFDSPLLPIFKFYRARVLTWETLESGATWKNEDRRRAKLSRARPLFESASRAFPGNRIIRMYLGEPIPPSRIPAPAAGAPEWAVHQREAIERLTDIIHWWIENRMLPNGEYGGGWGDDCEMWRWWVPVLIAFDDPAATEAQRRFSSALLAQPHMEGGYTHKMSDVEHTAEDTADAITPMMFLDPASEEWRGRALRLAELMRDLWTGTNERGFLQYKGTYFTVDRVDPEPRKACDSVYHARAVQPALLYWQRTADPDLTRLFTTWLDTWVEATARAERGKPAGVIPSTIHWPDGRIGGLAPDWWKPGNHTDDPLYVWPSAMGMMTNSLLLANHMTGDEKYLEPIRSMARIRLRYVKNPPLSDPEPGSEAWCAARMAGIAEVVAKYKLLTGGDEFDELIALESDPYMSLRLNGDLEPLTDALRDTALSLRTNFAGYTSEVRYTDRVLRFPRLFSYPAMYPEPLATFSEANTDLLFASLTGEPAGGLYFPINAVRWLTPPRDIAALVTRTAPDGVEAQLFHFGPRTRSMAAELYLIESGSYDLTLTAAKNGKILLRAPVRVDGQRTRVQFILPSRKLCVLKVERKNL